MTRERQDPTIEIRDRTRRIETRLTALILRMGGDTEAQKPRFDPGPIRGHATVHVPSPHSSLKEILDSLPHKCETPVDVYIGDDLVTTITARN